MQFKKTLFRIECFVTLLAILGKLGFFIAFHDADLFESTGVRTLWDLMILTPALLFLCPTVICQAITRSWSVKSSRRCMTLEILSLALFLLYYIILILSRTVNSDAFYRPLMLFLNNTWVFAILGGLHGLAPLIERKK